jgi:spore maturation protein CgeB
MKILVVNSSWVGGWLDHVIKGLNENNHETFNLSYKRSKSFLRLLKLNNIVQVRNKLEEQDWQRFNRDVIKKFEEIRPDVFLTMNESRLFPETIRHIKNNKCVTVCFVPDNPFDSHRYTLFPVSLKYFNKLLVSDRIWIQAITNVAPDSKVIKIPSGGAYNPEFFYPVEENQISHEEREKLSCDISFTGESYGILAEGGYRACILDQLGSFNVKIWGDQGWIKRFPFHSNLERFYQGDRLPYDHLRKLYHLSTININMPSPQIFTGFQPRVFEIAACKGFQIVDWREELNRYFNEDELVSFRNTKDLLEKAEYFIKNPENRDSYVEKAYNKVRENHTWEQLLSTITPEILN